MTEFFNGHDIAWHSCAKYKFIKRRNLTMKMGHVTIKSAAYEKSIEFYKEIVGLSVEGVMENNGMRITFLANGKGETAVEIIDAPEKAYNGSGISIGFSVENVKDYHDELEAKGLNPTQIITPNPKMGFFFVSDPNGVQIQFMGAI